MKSWVAEKQNENLKHVCIYELHICEVCREDGLPAKVRLWFFGQIFALFFAACVSALLFEYKVCCKIDKRWICPTVPNPCSIIVSQRGGWEGHAHSHFSWCERKISSMTQRTFGLRWRWYSVASGAYFSTLLRQKRWSEFTVTSCFAVSFWSDWKKNRGYKEEI